MGSGTWHCVSRGGLHLRTHAGRRVGRDAVCVCRTVGRDVRRPRRRAVDRAHLADERVAVITIRVRILSLLITIRMCIIIMRLRILFMCRIILVFTIIIVFDIIKPGDNIIVNRKFPK